MPFIQSIAISSELRKQHESAYKAQLRQALTNPGLSAEQYKRIKDQIVEIGKSKVYRVDSPPKPGAISFQDPLPPRDVLESLKRDVLLTIARRLRVPTDGTRTQLVDRILSATHNGG